MPQQELVNPDAIAKFMESDDYTKLPPKEKEKVFEYLKSKIRAGTPPIPSAGEGVAERRRSLSPLGSILATRQKSTTGRILSGGATGIENIIETPSAIKHAVTDAPTEEEKSRKHPLGLTLDRLIFDPQVEQLHKSKEAFKEGKVSEGLGYAGAGILPLAGPMAAQTGEQVGRGEWAESLGENAVYFLAGLGAKKLTPKGVKPWQRLSSAAGGGTKDFELVMRDLAETAKKTGKPNTVEDLYKLVRQTGIDMETDFNQALQPIANQEIMPADVARNLLKEAEKFDTKTPEGRAARQYIRQRAIDYQRPWKLGELNQKRMKMFDAPLEGKTDVKQMGAVRNSVEQLADKVIEDSLRDVVYDTMESKYKGKFDFRSLKEKQARLLDLNHRLQLRVEEIADAEAKYRSAGPLKRAGLYVRGHITGISPAIHPKLEGAPEKSASKQIGKAFSRVRNPMSARPAGKRVLPPLDPQAPPKPQTPVKSNPSPTTGYYEGDVDEVTRRGPGKEPEGETDVRTRQAVADFSKQARERKLPPLKPDKPKLTAAQTKEYLESKHPNRVTVNVGGEDRRVVLSDEQMKAWKEAKADYERSISYAEKTFKGEELASRKKGYGMKYAADKRQITGQLTTKEIQNKAAYEATNYKGKFVSVKGKPGTVIGTAFGKITIKMEDGSVLRVHPEDIERRTLPPLR